MNPTWQSKRRLNAGPRGVFGAGSFLSCQGDPRFFNLGWGEEGEWKAFSVNIVNIVNIEKLAKPLCRFSSPKLFLCLPTMPWEDRVAQQELVFYWDLYKGKQSPSLIQ